MEVSVRKTEFKIKSLKNFSKIRKRKLKRVLKKLETAVNSAHFKNLVMYYNHGSFNGPLDGSIYGFRHNRGLTNKEIYEAIRCGSETLTQGDDFRCEFELEIQNTPWWKRRFVRAMAFTYRNTNKITIRDIFFDRLSDAKLAELLIHEWLHNLGFEHEYYVTNKTYQSVPYGVGSIISHCVLNQEGRL